MTNPLLLPSPLAYELPDFSQIRFEHYREALEAGFAQHTAEIDEIVADPQAPTFENTIVAMEKAGALLTTAAHVFFNKCSADSTPELLDLESEMAPRFSAHLDSIMLNPKLFGRVKAVHEGLDSAGLEGEDRQLVVRIHDEMSLRGAGLGDEDRAKLAELNQQISQLETDFSRKLLDDTNDSAVVFDSVDELDGASPAQISACQAAAEARGLAGKYVVTLILPTDQPLLESLHRRESRRRLLEAALQRGNRGNQFDTNETILELVKLRAQRAALLGFPNYAALAAADQTAKTPGAIEERIYPMAAPAARNAEAEAKALQEFADAEQDRLEQPRFELAAWDWAYYTEKVRAQKFSFESSALAPYFEYNRVLTEGVFFAANKLYGLEFKEREDLAGYHPDVRVFEVFDEAGDGIGLFLHDVYTRDSKRGGAWMNNLVDQSRLLGQRPVICNNLNVPKPADGPTLLTLDEVSTMFHEFGHALHGLLSNCRYPHLSGTSVPRDFVEFPSQVNEMWMDYSEVLQNYAKHHETGEPLPAEVIKKLQEQSTFNQGYLTCAYLGAALLDQEWHKIGVDTTIESVAAFEQAALERIGLDNPLIPPRYHSTYFNHTFGGGYDAGYYAYIWAEVLDADAVAWFKENGGLTRDNGRVFATELLSRGLSRDPLESYRAFRGKDADPKYLLERRGIAG